MTKPVDYLDFSEAMRRVLRVAPAIEKQITVESGKETIEVPVARIRYIVAGVRREEILESAEIIGINNTCYYIHIRLLLPAYEGCPPLCSACT